MVYQVFQKVAELLDWDNCSACTRCGRHHYKKTKDVATLRKIFAHSIEKITKRYIGINEDEISEAVLSFRLGF